MRAIRAAVIITGLLWALSTASATTNYVTWNPGEINPNWHDSKNWIGTGYPDDYYDCAIFSTYGVGTNPVVGANIRGAHGGLGRLVFETAGWSISNKSGEDNLLYFYSQENFSTNAIFSRGSGVNTINLRVVFTNASQNVYTASGNTLVFAKPIEGTFAPTISTENPFAVDTGAVRLDTNNTVTNAFTVRQGTLLVRHSGALGTATTLSIGDDWTTNGATARLLTDAAGVIINKNITVQNISNHTVIATIGGNQTSGSSSYTGTIAINRDTMLTAASGGTVTFSGAISGSGGINKIGAGPVVLSAQNSYTGPTIISSGMLQLGTHNALPTATALTLSNTAGAVLNLNNYNQTVATVSGGGTSGGNIALGSGTLTVGAGNYAGGISGSGHLVKTGSGTLILGAQNSYGGTTLINGGTLQLGTHNALPTGTSLSLSNTAGATLNLNSYNQQIGMLTGGGSSGGHIALGSGTLTVGSGNYAGVISGSGHLVKTGSGTLVLAGQSSYSGSTIINAGTLQLGAANALPTTTALTLANVAGAILDLNNNNQQLAQLTGGGSSGGHIALGSGTLTVGSGNYAGVISGSGHLVKTGSGTLVLAGQSSYTGTTTINGGTLQLSTHNALPTATALSLSAVLGVSLNLNNYNQAVGTLTGGGAAGGGISLGTGTLTVGAGNYSGVISGSGHLVKAGSGTLVLGAQNSYGGSTIINAGTLQLGAANALPTTTALTLANVAGAILDLNNNNQQLAQLMGGGPGGGNINLGTGTLTVGSGNYAGVISGSGHLVKTGTGTLTLSGTNSYTGTTTISDGRLQLGADNPLPKTTALTLANKAGALLDLNGFNQQLAALYGGGSDRGNVVLNSGTLTVDAGNYAGSITGPGALNKSGNDTLTLTGKNWINGQTRVRGGTLLITAEHTSTAGMTVDAGATLGGTGKISGPVNCVANSRLAPGLSIGTLTIDGNLTLGGTLQIELEALGESDLVQVNGELDITRATAHFFWAEPPQADAYVFARYSVLIGEQFSAVINLPPGYWIDYQYHGNQIAAVIPEPNTAWLLALGLGILRLFARPRTSRGSQTAALV